MKYALWITGIPACLAIVFPRLVATAYFFLIVPGVILTIAPTVFVYLAGTAGVRRVIPIASPVGATVLSFALTLGVGWGVMQPFRAAALKAYTAACEPDITPNHKIALHGRVLIDTPDAHEAPRCNYLCLAALDLPLVESVTMVTGGRDGTPNQRRSAAYQLESADTNPAVGLFPDDPAQIIREFRPLAKAVRGTQIRKAAKAVYADWAMRLSGPLRLRETQAVESNEADWLIRIDDLNQRPKTKLRRITISDSTGTVRFRKSYRRQAIPSAMFHFGFEAFAAGGPISAASFHIGRQFLTSGTSSLHPETELLTAINFPTPTCDAAIVDQLRFATEEALSNPNAPLARIDLARRYLGLFFFDATESDYELIARIVSDNRVTNIDHQLTNVFSKSKTPTAMKNAYAERIAMPHTSAALKTWLAESLAQLPAGTFSNPSPAHLEIWTSSIIYQDAGAFFSRTADLGAAAAIPLLQAALDDACTITNWNDRRALMHGIREAFVELGPSASSVAPQLCELFLRRPSPLMNNSGQADDWRFALARMGVDIRDLPFFQGQSPDTIERISRKVAQRLSRYEQKLIAGTNP